ncbi:at dna binding protein [Diplodia corticola]|uniref:At dna binding protein n=1 Tax=Diplodia corticola TaxID=236234 RepID=A0A1J9RTV5_9PEZI|nr:at dna binding protein [Diplodia corticola]OJD31300.1 at dna binding protein [Diplodia corticola]
MSSSPDPLTFVTSSSPSKSAATRRSAKRAAQPLAKLSSNVKRSDPFLELPDIANLSPSKSITMTTPKAAGSSPWHIKVTVEAQPQDGFSQDENSLTSPTGARQARIATTTTTVPLNDVDGSSPVKRRGRPRKADTPPAAHRVDAEVSPIKKRGRPRKSDAAIASQTATVPLNDARGSSPVRRKGRATKAEPTPVPGRARNGTPVRKTRKSVTRSPDQSETDSSHSDASYYPTKRGGARGGRSMSKDVHVAEPIRATAMYGPRSPYQLDGAMDTGSSVGQKRRSTAAGSQLEAQPDAIEEEEAEDLEQTPKASSSKKATTDEEMWRSMISHHEYESEQTAEEEDDSSDNDLDIVMPDHTVGETTMLHSEEFSMVSLYSLPSMQAARNGLSPKDAQPNIPKIPSLRTDPIPQVRRERLSRHAVTSSVPEFNDSVASVSYMPSSPPERFITSTPAENQSLKSPSGPPAIQQAEISPSKAEAPKLVNVVKAAIALQGVVNGNNRGTQNRRPSDDIREEAQRARLDDMFNQFQAGTRRELQAGLRLGEQLAERARSRNTSCETASDEPERNANAERLATPASTAASDGDVFDGPSTNRSPNHDSSNHRLPTPDENDYALPSPPPPPSQLLTQQPDPAVAPAPAQLFSPARSQASPDAGDMQDDGARTPPSIGKEKGEKSTSHQGSGPHQKTREGNGNRRQRRRQGAAQMADEPSPSQVIEISSDGSESTDTTTESSENPWDGDIWEEEGGGAPESRFARRARRVAAKRSGEKTGDVAGPSNPRSGNASRSSQPQSSSPPSDSTQAPDASSAASRTRNTAGRRSARAQRSSRQESIEPTTTSEAAVEVESTEDTGLFWQRSSESPAPRPTQPESKKLDLSMLMAIDDSPAKEVKEPVLATPPKLEPLRLPYNIGTAAQNSPVRGSPLKQQVIFSSPSAVNSSPYQRIEHTIASSVLNDGDTMMIDEEDMTLETRQWAQALGNRAFNGRQRVIPPSPAVFAEEDRMVQRQIENELTPRSARIKNLNLSGDGKRLFANNDSAVQSETSVQEEQSYLVQKQSEQSAKRSSRLSSHSAQRSSHAGQNTVAEDTHMEREQPAEPSILGNRSHMTALNLNRERKPLFEQRTILEQKQRAPLFDQKPLFQSADIVPASAPKTAPQEVAQSAGQPSTGLFGRLWGAIATTSEPEVPQLPPQLPLHPLAQRYKHLPRVAPWTKSHWDSLDRIYQRYKRHPDEFSPHDPLHKALLAQRLRWQPDSSETKPASDYAGVEMQRWNYTVRITPELLVCCTIFMQLLTLRDAAEYRRVTGQDIVHGNFMQKDKAGDPITLRDVIARMFAAVGGERIRADEKRGVRIRRDLDQFKLRYPWAPGWWDDMGKYVHD